LQNNKFYAGHSMEFMNKFIEAIPKKKKYHLDIAVGLTEVINHLSLCKKRNDNLILDHKILKEFGLYFQHIPRYLKCFEQAGLIELSLRKGAAPKVKLLFLDPLRYVPNYKQINKVHNKGNKRNLMQMHKAPSANALGDLMQIREVENPSCKGPKEPPKGGKQGEGLRKEEGPHDQ
jgi:hypothetical protein